MSTPTLADKKEELAQLFFQCARYERPSTDWIAALDSFASEILQAGAADAVPPGYIVVPEVPTTSMTQAGAVAARRYLKETGGNSPQVIYTAMLEAAPKDKV